MPVFTAPKAYIKIDNKVAGYVRNLTWQENIQRANVQGLGQLILQEVPPVGYQCTWSVDQYFLDLKQPVMESLLHRLGDVNAIVNTLILGELTFQMMVYQKTIASQDGNTQMVTSVDNTGQTIVMLGPCYTNSFNFQLQEGAVAAIGVQGIFLNPISTANF